MDLSEYRECPHLSEYPFMIMNAKTKHIVCVMYKSLFDALCDVLTHGNGENIVINMFDMVNEQEIK